jgi:general secretion pathway protein I
VIRQDGLSLLEVMVALMVVAMVLGAVLSALGSSAANHAHLTQRSLAQWVGQNRLVEAQLGLLPQEAGDDEGEDQMGSRRWRWSIRREPSGEPGLQRVTVEVADPRTPQEIVYRASGLRLVSSERP